MSIWGKSGCFGVRLRASGRNIVYQQLPTLLDVTCCARLHTLLHVVGCCCVLLRKVETGQTFQPTTRNISFVPRSPKRSATMLDPFAQLFQHCWATHLLQRLVGCILPTMHCRSLHCTELLDPFADHCQHTRNNFQQCWELLRPFARSLTFIAAGWRIKRREAV